MRPQGALDVDYPNLRRFSKATHELAAYIADHADSIINYGERFELATRFDSFRRVRGKHRRRQAVREATADAVDTTPGGAHLLLQSRTYTLDGTLRPTFECWYPGLATDQAVAIDHTHRTAASIRFIYGRLRGGPQRWAFLAFW